MDKDGEFKTSSPCSECGQPGCVIHGQHALCTRHASKPGPAMPDAISKVAERLMNVPPGHHLIIHDPEL